MSTRCTTRILSAISHILTDTRHIKMFVLDEADEMLSRGFKDQIYDVFRKLPSTIQVRMTGVGGMAHYSLIMSPFTHCCVVP